MAQVYREDRSYTTLVCSYIKNCFNTPPVDVEENKKKEFHDRVNNVWETVRLLEGFGEIGQKEVDERWKELEIFVQEHPEYERLFHQRFYQKPTVCDNRGYEFLIQRRKYIL